ncbi:hypothetical protein Anas_13248, partial [Armadillidium nasatum]
SFAYKGLGLYSSYHGVHQISMLRALSPVSPAYTCGKLMCGDQVVQVGWTSLKVTQLMQENPVQVILTMKKCPTHVNTVTEIYFKPFRLPSKKRTYSPWMNNTISHQQYNLQSIPNLQFIKSFDGRTAAQRVINTEPHPKSLTPPSASLNSSGSDVGAITASESDSEDLASDLDDDAFLSDIDYGRSGTPSGRLFQPKPRPHVQRRATIPGASARHTLPFDQLLEGYCHRPLVPSPIGDSLSSDAYQYVFRNNKDSLDARITRPHTCIGTEKKKSGKGGHHWKRPDDGEMPFIDESDEKEEVDWKDSSLSSKGSQNSMKNTLSPILSQTDKENADKDSQKVPTNASTPKFEMKNEHKILDDRPKLDKSYSSPTYDLDDGESSVFTDKTTTLNPSRSKGILTLEILNEKSECESISNTEEKTVKAEEKNVIKYSENIVDESKEVIATTEETFVPSRAEVYSVAANEVKESCLKPSPPSVTHSQSSYLSQESYHETKGGSRRISCRDLGLGDHHGWLYRRKDSKGFLLSHRWEKRWFILKKNSLYGYRDKDSLKADSLIYLPGFHVCPAPEVKSKRFTFKIYHSSGATFYFACDTTEERSRWMSQMGMSAISSVSPRPSQERESTSCSP